MLRFQNDVKEIILFGSQLSGKTDIDSDYDVLILLKKELNWQIKNEIRNVCSDLALANDIIFDIKILSESDLNNKIFGKLPLIKDALLNGTRA